MAGMRSSNKQKTGARRNYSKAHEKRTSRQRSGTLRRVLFTALVIAAVVATALFLVLRSNNGISMFENVVGTVFKPIESGLSSAANGVKDFFRDWRDYGKLKNEYELLQMENERLSLQLSGAEEMELENERLSALLDASEAYETLDPIYAKVIARDPGQWFNTFSINRGTSNGVTKGMTVVTGDGLVGYVYEAGLTYAKVLSIVDSRSRLSCLVQRTRDNGVMRGEVTSGSDNAECYVYYLPNINNITPGDVIVTSGTDSLYPKGLVIGEVIAVSQETSADGSYVVVSPYVDFLHIEEVLVLRSVIETDSDLAAVPTPTPIPAMTPKPTKQPVGADGDVIEPQESDGNWSFPTATPTPAPTMEPTPEPTRYEILPEDMWAT